MHVYLKNLWVDSPANSTAASGSGLPSYNGSLHKQTARAVYQRLKKVLWLQWRGIVIVTIILVDVIFFAIVFVYLDGLQSNVPDDIADVMPWLLCLVEHPTNKNKCLKEAQSYLVNEKTVVAVLMLLSLAGIQVFLFLTRPSIFPAWIEFFRNRFTSRQEFVSLDARQEVGRSASQQNYHSYDRGYLNTTFEMQKPEYTATITGPLSVGHDRKYSNTKKTQDTFLLEPEEAYHSPLHDPPSAPSYENKSRLPPGYSERMSPDSMHTYGSPARRSPHDSDGSMNPILPRQNSTRTIDDPNRNIDYFTSSPPSSRAGGERRYNPPNASFSVPKAPSRQGSLNHAHNNSAGGYDSRTRGGLGLHPPQEEDNTDWNRR